MLLGDAFIKRVSTVPRLHLLSLCYVPVYYVSGTFTTLTRVHDIDTYSHCGTCTFTHTFATLRTNSLYLPRTVTLFLAHSPCHVIHYRTNWHNYCYTHTHNIHSHCWVCFWGLQAHSRCYSHIHSVECAIGGHTHTDNVIRTFTLLSVLLSCFFFFSTFLAFCSVTSLCPRLRHSSFCTRFQKPSRQETKNHPKTPKPQKPLLYRMVKTQARRRSLP